MTPGAGEGHAVGERPSRSDDRGTQRPVPAEQVAWASVASAATPHPRKATGAPGFDFSLAVVLFSPYTPPLVSTTDDPRSNPARRRRPSRVSPKGQVTIPKPVRDHLGIEPGSAVEFDVTPGGDVVLRKRPDSARALRGMLQAYAPNPAPTLEQLRGAARDHVAKRHGVSVARNEQEPGADGA